MMASIFSSGEEQNCTNVDGLLKRYYLPVAYTAIFVVGLVGNLTSLGVYLTKLRPLNSSSIIMVNLALTDLLYVLTLPFLVYYYSNGDIWTLGHVMCRFVRVGFYVNLYGSILSLTCLAVFRYVVVTKPLLAARVQQRVWGVIACSVVWSIAIAEITPMLTMISLEPQDNKTCLDFASTAPVEKVRCYSLILTALGFLVPLIVVFMCCLCIVKTLASGPNNSCPRRKKARHVTVLILVVFVLCFLPYHILRVLRIETRMMKDVSCMTSHAVHAAYIISRPLAGFNTFFNLAFYTLSGVKFRKAFLSTFYWNWQLTKDRLLFRIATISKKANDQPSP